MTEAYIYDAIRTPRGKARPDGGLHDHSPLALQALLYKALEQRTGLDPAFVEDVILGCVTQSGEQAANIAKTSTLYAGWPSQIPGMTVNRFCSSGIDAIQIAALKVIAGEGELFVAGGIEMMSRVAMLSDKPAAFLDKELAKRLGMHLMGSGADLIASLYKVTREEADKVAFDSQRKASRASEQAYFKSIIPVATDQFGTHLSHDENIRPQTSLDSLSKLAPAFETLGKSGIDQTFLKQYPDLSEISHIHTAGNSPAMADGASLLLVGSHRAGEQLGHQPRARIRAMATANANIQEVVSGCINATQKILLKENMSVADIDLFEIHEAFAATIVKCQKELQIPDDKLNVNGGCIALGHPLGATGAIMTGTLLDELERRDLKRGIVSASGAAGLGSAILIERF